MPLNDLVQVIETIKKRISVHGDSLRQNETRTRMALIDPLLTALGWDVADPELVTAEYKVADGRADYALMKTGHTPAAAVIEAKRLGSFVENHLNQMVNYCISQGIPYAAVTDGDHWQMYRTFEPVPLEQKRVLDVQIGATQAFECALNFLLLWQPNLASGQPVPAEQPILSPTSSPSSSDSPPQNSGVTPKEGWTPLSSLDPGRNNPPPTAIKLPDGEEKQIGAWNGLLLETAEFLVRAKKLTPAQCPIPVPNSSRYAVHTSPIHSNGKNFTHIRQLSNDLHCEVNANAQGLVRYANAVLRHCGQDPASVHVKLG